MANIEITVKDVRWPAPGKKTGIVEDTTGKWWGVWPDKLGNFKAGLSYQITDFDSREFNGKVYYTIRQATPISGLQGQQAAQNRMSAGAASPRSQGSDDGQRRLDIFVCGAFNNLLSNPNINPVDMSMMDMIDILHKFKGAWMGVFGPSPLPVARRPDPISSGPSDPALNDDIPF